MFSRESRTTNSLLETIQRRRKTCPCIRGLNIHVRDVGKTARRNRVEYINYKMITQASVNRELNPATKWLPNLDALSVLHIFVFEYNVQNKSF